MACVSVKLEQAKWGCFLESDNRLATQHHKPKPTKKKQKMKENNIFSFRILSGRKPQMTIIN